MSGGDVGVGFLGKEARRREAAEVSGKSFPTFMFQLSGTNAHATLILLAWQAFLEILPLLQMPAWVPAASVSPAAPPPSVSAKDLPSQLS